MVSTNRLKWNAVRFIVILALAAVPSFASSIFVNNFDFETLPSGGLTGGTCGVAPGCYSFAVAVPGWTAVAGGYGQFEPTSGVLAVPPAGAGGTMLFVNDGYMAQTVGATVGVGTVYTLSVSIGHRSDGPMGGVAELVVNGNTYLATGTDSGAGLWSTYTATYVGTSADAGKAIQIRLLEQMVAGAQAQGNFDGVSLSAVPEPASFLLFGSALLAIGAIRRRKSNA